MARRLQIFLKNLENMNDLTKKWSRVTEQHTGIISCPSTPHFQVLWEFFSLDNLKNNLHLGQEYYENVGMRELMERI